MKVTVLDLRRRTREIIEALDRNEKVTIYCRGKKKGVIHPASQEKKTTIPMIDHPACGMWADREDMADPVEWVRKIRKGRFNAD
ncbi:MAG TPA: type II toxin-antitoxin system Phd/YefM family antitoxin [bacterium]|nr:type II toxin-antitoxin system Phd/YefM family antitoxin [bacterium]